MILPAMAGNDKNYTYLALGDSVAFGFDPTLIPTSPGQPLPAPSKFVGYPEVVAQVEHLLQSKKEVNAACPGETSGSFMTPGAADYGCHSLGPQGQPPFKSSIGLKADYPGTQLAFAVSELASNKHINLVTLGIGSNDALLVIQSCGTNANPPACVQAQLPAVLGAYAQNLAHILTSIRANYGGQLILVKYYSPSPDLNPVAQALNQVMQQVGQNFGVRFADGYSAFQLASALYHGDPCKAGLLVRLSPTTCDIHPSPIGRDILAATVELAQLGIQ